MRTLLRFISINRTCQLLDSPRNFSPIPRIAPPPSGTEIGGMLTRLRCSDLWPAIHNVRSMLDLPMLEDCGACRLEDQADLNNGKVFREFLCSLTNKRVAPVAGLVR